MGPHANTVILRSDVITVVFPIRLDPVVSDEFLTTEGHSGSADSSCVQCERSEEGDHSSPLLGESLSPSLSLHALTLLLSLHMK